LDGKGDFTGVCASALISVAFRLLTTILCRVDLISAFSVATAEHPNENGRRTAERFLAFPDAGLG